MILVFKRCAQSGFVCFFHINIYKLIQLIYLHSFKYTGSFIICFTIQRSIKDFLGKIVLLQDNKYISKLNFHQRIYSSQSGYRKTFWNEDGIVDINILVYYSHLAIFRGCKTLLNQLFHHTNQDQYHFYIVIYIPVYITDPRFFSW